MEDTLHPAQPAMNPLSLTDPVRQTHGLSLDDGNLPFEACLSARGRAVRLRDQAVPVLLYRRDTPRTPRYQRDASPARGPQKSQLDPVLLPFLRAKGEVEGDRQLEKLLAEIDPAIKRIVAKRWGVSPNSAAFSFQIRGGLSAEDLYSDVRLRLTRRLKKLRTNPERLIEDFRAYVVATIYNVYHDAQRVEHPQRNQLKAAIYTLLQDEPRLTSRKGDDRKLVCGLANQNSAEPKPVLDDPQGFVRTALPREMASAYNLSELVVRILEYSAGPVELDDLVDFVAKLQGLPDQPIASLDDEPSEPRDPGPDPADEVERLEVYQRVWEGICRLPLPQRIAFLLNGEACAVLQEMHAEGVIRLHQVADALELPIGDCAELWNHLPLQDLVIAERLGILEMDAPARCKGKERRHWVQQQVINLRHAARKAMATWMHSYEKES